MLQLRSIVVRPPRCVGPRLRAPARVFAAAAADHSDPFAGLPSNVKDAVHALSARLATRDVPYCIVGGAAVNAAGHRRATQDVDVLVNPDDLERFVEAVDGAGYRRRCPDATRSWRDSVNSVDVDVRVSGEFPGDGKPKPVSFPRVKAKPNNVVDKLVGSVRVISLPRLIEVRPARGGQGGLAHLLPPRCGEHGAHGWRPRARALRPTSPPPPLLLAGVSPAPFFTPLPLFSPQQLKLASAASAPSRVKDAADVLELINANALPYEFVVELDISVRPLYVELWDKAQAGRRAGM